MFSQFY